MTEKTYLVKKIFGPTIQGEGSLVGTVTAFLRFGGCNVWDGRAETKAASGCPYCDTDFRGGERLSAAEIVTRLRALVPDLFWVTISGGEPLLQLDEPLAAALHQHFRLAIETNGTVPLSEGVDVHIDHVVCSPKVPRDQMALSACHDLKVLYPHPNPAITPETFADYPARWKFLQPVNAADALDPVAVRATVEKLYQLGPDWELSAQLHKAINVE